MCNSQSNLIAAPKQGEAASGLCALILRGHETWFTFSCSVCGKPIVPPSNGNVVWNNPDPYVTTPLEPFEDERVERLDVPVHVVHKGCDPHDCLGRCWVPLDAVLKLNQNWMDERRQRLAPSKSRQQKWARERAREFKELCALEPRLLTLYERAKSIRDDGKSESFCANAVWYGYSGHPGLKPTLCKLVGYVAARNGADPRLGTSQAYDAAYRTIYEVLPSCRDCGCL